MTTSPSDFREAEGLVTDLAVIGAGPAGLSAAVAAADAGVTVGLLDSEPAVGGQFWRHPARTDEPGGVADREVAVLHHNLGHYRRLRRRLAGHVAVGTVRHLARHEVWAVHVRGSGAASATSGPSAGSTGDVPAGTFVSPRSGVSDPAGGGALPGARFAVEAVTEDLAGRRTTTVLARSLVLATGAHDLQLPFPGWNLPGVMTAGGVQALLKGHGVLAGRRVVVAGTGPFLLSVASGLLRSGATVPGVFEASSPRAWLREPRAVLAAGSKLLEGAGYAAGLLRRRVGYRTGWTVLAANGADRLETVTVAPLDRAGTPVPTRSRTVRADALAVGWGFVPRLDLAIALGCGTVPGGDGQPVVVVDSDQRSTVPGVFAAGEVCGVGGAALAAIEGEVAGRAAAEELARRPAEDQLAERAMDPRRVRLLRRRAALREFAGALQRAYPVPDRWAGQVPDETVLCRCEEVTAGAIREVVRRAGITDARSAKLLVRPGMGWCQGRICGYATECLVAAESGSVPDHRPVERPVAAPIPLGLVGPVGHGGPTAPAGAEPISKV